MWRPARILAGTDYSPAAEAAVSAALGVARRTGAAVDLVHAINDRSQAVTGYAVVDDLLVQASQLGRRQERAAGELRRLARRLGPPEPGLHVVEGDPAAELLALRDEWKVDLVALGARGLRGLRRFLLGSVADQVLRRPGPPLLLVNRAPRSGEFKRILVGIEDPDRIRPWFEHALGLARDLRAELVLLHVLPPTGYVSDGRRVELDPGRVPEKLERSAARFDPTQPIEVTVQRGDAAEAIPQAARSTGAELVVLGAERHPDGWPGRVADRVARSGLPALLVVWPSG